MTEPRKRTWEDDLQCLPLSVQAELHQMVARHQQEASVGTAHRYWSSVEADRMVGALGFMELATIVHESGLGSTQSWDDYDLSPRAILRTVLSDVIDEILLGLSGEDGDSG